MQRLGLAIDGMHCEACVRRVKRALGKVAGVTIEDVTVGSARVAFDPAATDPEAIAAAVRSQGFEARVASG